MKKKSNSGGGISSISPWVKSLLIMKMIIILSLFVGLLGSYASTKAQTAKLNLKIQNGKVKDVIEEIERLTDYSFVYDNNIFDVNKNIVVDARASSVDEILEQILKGENLNYEIVNRFIVISSNSVSPSSSQQQKQISGKIVGSDGMPLPGVTVYEKGTSNGTITDIDGNYSLKVSAATSVLVFSFVGMETQEVPVANKTVIDVKLIESSIGLEEVVAIGYGTVKKKDITGSVASVSGEQLSAVPVANAAQALKGRLPGVNVVSQDGRPDAQISIRVRGGGSVSQSNDPLFIVDGFPVSSISDIPGTQIESIDVLKDASSTAIYGARGANGVIIVTTKSGKSGKLTINYDGYAQFNRPTKYFPTMSAYDYIAYNWAYATSINDGYAQAWEKLWAIGRYEGSANPEGIDHYKNVDATNFQKEVYNNSFTHSHNLSISNGNEKTKYLFSVNHIDEDGMKVNSYYKRTNVSFKIDQNLSEKLKFAFDTRFTNTEIVSNESTSSGQGSLLTSAYYFRPIATKDVLGDLNENTNSQLGFYTNILQDNYNPVARIMDYTPLQNNRTLRANTSLSWEIITGLTATSELGISTYWNKSKTWTGAIYNDYFDAEGNKKFGGNASMRSSQGWSARWANTLNYTVQGLGDDHTLTILAGMEVSDSGSERIDIFGRYYPASFDADRAYAMMDQYDGTSATNYGLSSETGTPNRLNSYFGRFNYSLKGKYLLTGTFRADGSSRFAPSNRWGYFPAAAVAWRLSEEDFLKEVDWLDNLKMRLSYGSVGNDGISANLWKMSYASDGLSGYSIEEQQQLSYSPASATIANPDLKWETTITRNLGFDYGLLDNRIYGTLDLYFNSTKDLLMLTSVSAISGFSYTYDNVGSTSNKGIEFAIGADLVRSKDFNLSTNFNINFNKGNVEELAEGVTGLYKSLWAGTASTEPETGDYILQEGKPVGQVRGFTFDGWYSVDDFDYTGGKYVLKSSVPDIASGFLGTVYGTTALKPGGQVAYPGVAKYRDISGPNGTPDGVVDDYDVSIIGDMNPKHTGGFSLSGNYKNLDFRMDFNWSYGNKVYNANYLSAFLGSKEDGLYRNRLDYLTNSFKIYDIQNGQISSVTDPAALKALNANADTYLPYHENAVVSTMGIDDGSYLRLNTVTLGYTLSENVLNKIGIQKIRVYGSIYNAFTITNYRGLDPEVNTNTSQGNAVYPTTGLDFGSYPRARSFTLGLNIEF